MLHTAHKLFSDDPMKTPMLYTFSRHLDLYHEAWADKDTPTISIRHTPWHSLGQLTHQCLLTDPQLCGKHWLIELWYKSAVPFR